MSPPSAPAADLRADAARNRERVLEVARDQLRAGDLSLAMNLIARQAGVGVGTVYRHFPTRQVLLETLIRTSLEHLLHQTQTAADELDPRLGLRKAFSAWLACLLDDPALVAVLRSPLCACTETSELASEMGAAFCRLLVRAREAGVVRPDVTGDDLKRHILGLEQTVRLGSREQAQIDRDLDILLAGLRPQL